MLLPCLHEFAWSRWEPASCFWLWKLKLLVKYRFQLHKYCSICYSKDFGYHFISVQYWDYACLGPLHTDFAESISNFLYQITDMHIISGILNMKICFILTSWSISLLGALLLISYLFKYTGMQIIQFSPTLFSVHILSLFFFFLIPWHFPLLFKGLTYTYASDIAFWSKDFNSDCFCYSCLNLLFSLYVYLYPFIYIFGFWGWQVIILI